MTLQRAIFFIATGFYAVSLLSAVAMLVVVGINFFNPRSVSISIPLFTFAGCLCLRLIFALWLRKLGGVPQEFRPK